MADALGIRQPDILDTDASSSVVCHYVAGVNRVLSLPPYLLVDNIGRNFEVWRFESDNPEPAARAFCDFTSYPDDPMAALLDLDIHAAFLRREGRELVAVNHYGRVRAFDLPASVSRMQPQWERQLLGDTERVVLAGECFIASSPRGEFTEDPAQPGIFLFEPLAVFPAAATGAPSRLECDQALESWGVIGALALSASGQHLAVAASERLGVFDLMRSGAGRRLGDCLWEAPSTVECQWLHVDEEHRLWAGGGDRIDRFSLERGQRDFTCRLPDVTAWGYGADPIVLSDDGREIYALGRDASLHVVDVATGASAVRGRALPGDSQTRPRSDLGIGHAAMREGWLYAGFSRGGFRLLRYDLHTTRL
jgi:hypothetical protein